MGRLPPSTRHIVLRNAETTSAAVDTSCDLLALFVARSKAFALAALDFTESEPQMIVGSMAADTYLATNRDPLLSSVTANARRSSFSRTGLMQSFGVYQ